MLLQLLQGLGHHGAQEHAGVDQAVEAAAYGPSASGQVDGRADRADGTGRGGRAVAGFLGPAQQGIATERNTGCDQGAAMCRLEARQHPADLFEIPGVIGARRQVQLARAAAEMRQGKGPAARARNAGKGPDIVALRAAFEAVEKHQQRRIVGMRSIEPLHVDEVAVRRRPALAPELGGFAFDSCAKTGPARWFAPGRRAARAARGTAKAPACSMQGGRAFAQLLHIGGTAGAGMVQDHAPAQRCLQVDIAGDHPGGLRLALAPATCTRSST